jgi:hypothetical protein
MELGQVIASRTFELEGGTAELLIGMPAPFDDGCNFYCPFQLKGVGDERVRYAGGIDAVQALILALDIADVYIETRPETKDGRLTFLGRPAPGFRKPAS